jgi:formylmethanofuran dehydrogenase subunit E
VGIEEPRRAGKGLVVFVEIDRCATDAIQVLTGVSLGKQTLKPVDYGKMAATFVNVSRGTAVRVVARDDARARVPRLGARGGRSAPGPDRSLSHHARARAVTDRARDGDAGLARPPEGARLL